ncbi:hypothetical protein DFQ30_003378 [Apophysomyces sp. BC1015]|nr:hypothetical protein DFQ30_003378 [Apophysomyces sp. BC1015]
MQPNPGPTGEPDAERVERERIRRLFGRTDMRKRGEILAAMIAARNQKSTTRKRPHPTETEAQNEDNEKTTELTDEDVAARAKQRKKDIKSYRKRIIYSSYYKDEEYQYRHVILPQAIARYLPHFDLLTTDEWYDLGVRQAEEWKHYMVHAPEPHILLFRRPISCAEKEAANESGVDQANRADVLSENEETIPTEEDGSHEIAANPSINESKQHVV